MFQVPPKITLIHRPIVIDTFEARVVEGMVQFMGVLVIEDSKTIESILEPVTFVSKLTGLVIEPAEACHFVLDPLSVVKPTVLVKELALAVAHIVKFETFVARTLLERLHNVLHGFWANTFACFRLMLMAIFLLYWSFLLLLIHDIEGSCLGFLLVESEVLRRGHCLRRAS